MITNSKWVAVIALFIFFIACQRDEPATDNSHTSEGKAARTEGETVKVRDERSAIRAIDTVVEKGWGTSNFDKAEEEIKHASPTQFSEIWEKLSTLPDGEQKLNLQASAIFYLSAQKDLLAASKSVADLQGPGKDRNQILEQCLFLAQPSGGEVIDFLRSLQYPDEVQYLADLAGSKIVASGGLTSLQAAGYKLDATETQVMVKALSSGIIQPFGSDQNAENETSKQGYAQILEMQKSGVLGGQAGEEYLSSLGMHRPDVIFQVLPNEKDLRDALSGPGTDALVQKLAMDQPAKFFADGTIQNIPENKIGVAWSGWLEKDSDSAAKWYFSNQGQLNSVQTDAIAASFSQFARAKNEDESAVKWADSIHDEELRKKVLSEAGK